MTQDTVEGAFRLSTERAHELIEKYGRKPWEEYLKGKITNGQLISAFVELDELTVNEKCFLTAHCTSASMIVMMETKKRLKLAELFSGVY
jgi:hypothetical protein